ncbi:A-kinase-interacting protein 1 isoform X3 [Dendropsophus ebraccatus]
MEAADVWMEDSLRRSAELGRELLERARRRDVDWWSTCIHSDRGMGVRPGEETPQEERPASLDEAFSTLSQFMHQTTELCEVSQPYPSTEEEHKRNPAHLQISLCKTPARAREAATEIELGHRSPSVFWEDAECSRRQLRSGSWNVQNLCGFSQLPDTTPPGAHHPRAERGPHFPCVIGETHLVHITPGQSVDLTFHV